MSLANLRGFVEKVRRQKRRRRTKENRRYFDERFVFCKAGVDVVKQILKTQPAVKTAVPPASGIVRKKEMFGN